MKRILAIVLLVAAAGALGWYVLRDGTQPGRQSAVRIEAGAPLSFVPADTPYVLGNLMPTPPEVAARWYAQLDGMLEMYAAQFEQLRTTMAASGDTDPKLAALLDLLGDELAGKPPREWGAALGFGDDTRLALYGLGVVPVLRVELADPGRFRALLGRLEAALGEALPEHELDGQRYWSLTPPDAPLGGMLAIVDGHLVLSLLPAQPTPAVLRQVLGLDRPARTIADSGALQALNQTHGYTPYFSGYLDSVRLLEALTGPASPLDVAFLERLGIEKPSLSAACAGEWQVLAQTWPRLALGYRHFDGDGFDLHTVLETRSDIATELMTLRAPMPGLQAVREEALMHAGVALRIGALPTVVARFAERVAAAPWQCEALAPMNAAFANAQRDIANPAIYAAAPVASALHLVLNRLEFDGDFANPRLGGMLAIGSDNPAALIAMARSFVPGLAALSLSDGGSPQPLALPPGVPVSDPLHAAMKGKAIGLSIGAGEEAGLAAFLAIDEREQPLLALGVSAAGNRLIGQQVGSLMRQQAAAAPPEQRERLEREAALMEQMYTQGGGSSAVRLDLSPRGIELLQRMRWD
jgi:hypothetical protein